MLFVLTASMTMDCNVKCVDLFLLMLFRELLSENAIDFVEKPKLTNFFICLLFVYLVLQKEKERKQELAWKCKKKLWTIS